MSLTVLVKSASNLPNVEKFSKSDPICVIDLQGEAPSSRAPTSLSLSHASFLSLSRCRGKEED